MATKDDIANMITKDDLISTEGRILYAIKQAFMTFGTSLSLPTGELQIFPLPKDPEM
jgi:hypothetical protein